jgi:C1A family cysteine protease
MIYVCCLAFLSLAAATLLTPEITSAFSSFASRYGKSYDNAEEYAKRITIFAENFERMTALNEEHLLRSGEAVHGITKFMDLTPEEFRSTYLTYIPRDQGETVSFNASTIADAVDWRTKDVVTPVKDQGQCGSCWAFSATEAIESYAKLSGKYDLYELSPQQITSCDKVDGGCNGGNTETAYEYVQKAGGLESEAQYPYTSGITGRTGFCKASTNFKVSITGYTSVTKGEDNLKGALNEGPVSVCVAATAFQFYSGGILHLCPGQIDHCVQAVGYDDTASEPYWTLRNSWATDWGEEGYIRLVQGKDICKLADDVTFPTF